MILATRPITFIDFLFIKFSLGNLVRKIQLKLSFVHRVSFGIPETISICHNIFVFSMSN